MNCIICDKIANETGSHIVPASLMKNCIGKHYAEESYEIDSSKATVDVYFGPDNNKSTEIKKHHHKEDEILCKTCEKKLGLLESKFSTEFLQKFRVQKFNNNFESYSLSTGFEIFEPNRISNIEIHAYIYSIILRFCRDTEIKSGQTMLSEVELKKIKAFLNKFLYDNEDKISASIADFHLILSFDKYSDKGSYVFALEESKNPYIFYFCEVIVKLFTNEVTEKAKIIFNDCLNTITEQKAKIIVGPSQFFKDLMQPATKLIMKEIVTNGSNQLCELNNKSYAENLSEFNELVNEYDRKGIETPIFTALETLRKKYGG